MRIAQSPDAIPAPGDPTPSSISAKIALTRKDSSNERYGRVKQKRTRSSLPWLALLSQPTLVMAGTDDPIVPASTDAFWQGSFPTRGL
jgi:hypothetical protein